MTGPRRFARLRADPAADTVPLPDDGMCLSAYLLLRSPSEPRAVLMGRMNPSGPWATVAALDASRIARIGDRWVLPATQLLLFESPVEAARRIAQELLGRSDLAFGPPAVYSEAYARTPGPHDPHWDLQFVFSAVWPGGALEAAQGELWNELRFITVNETRASSFGRGHGDVLALAGFVPKGETPA